MRPLKLELEGFTSFPRRVAVDFTDLDLFAITGPTGAGKTSILDAMLFALFGHTPRIGQNEYRRLVSLGENIVKVFLEFQSAGKRYRITRTAKIAKSASTSIVLEEHIDGEEWNSIAGGVKETGARIREILGLDFEGFTRAVILPQGEFDKFLRGDPQQRTSILKDLLNLRIYERMMSTANARAKELRQQADMNERSIESMYADATEDAIQQLTEQIADCREQIVAKEHQMTEFESMVPVAQDLQRVREESVRCLAELDRAKRELAAAIAGDEGKQKFLQECEAKLTKLTAEVEATGYDEATWIELQQVLPLARQQTSLRGELGSRRKDREAQAAELPALDSAAKLAEQQHLSLHQALEQARQKATDAVDARSKLVSAHGSSETIQTVLAELHAAHAELDKLPARTHADAELARAESELEQQRVANVATDIRAHVAVGDRCPVCDQPIKKLPAAKPSQSLDAAKQSVEKARKSLMEVHRAESRLAIATQRASKITPEVSVVGLENLLTQSKSLDEAVGVASSEVESSQEKHSAASREALQLRQQHQLAEQQVTAMDKELRRAQDKLREAATAMGQFSAWAPLPMEELEAALDDQNRAKERKQSLEAQRSRVAEDQKKALLESMEFQSKKHSLQERIRDNEGRLEVSKKRYTELQKEFHAKYPELAQLEGIDEAAHLQKSIKTVELLLRALTKEADQAQLKVEDIQRRMEECRQRRAAICSQREEAGVLHRLGQLLQADEFIAFIQREALSRLAQEASAQLETLSEDRYTLLFSDNEFSVIDRWNADEQRSAKTLSGGESFLASLALALALSSSVASLSTDRVAARLDSLFIDEGISTLDPESLQTAIDAISTLTTGNRMVGVISHVAELGERLPARIRIEKAQGGSKIIVESGTKSAAATK